LEALKFLKSRVRIQPRHIVKALSVLCRVRSKLAGRQQDPETGKIAMKLYKDKCHFEKKGLKAQYANLRKKGFQCHVLPASIFKKMTKDVLEEQGKSITRDAAILLQIEAEKYILKVLQQATRIVDYSGRKTLKGSDVELAGSIIHDDDALYEQAKFDKFSRAKGKNVIYSWT